MRETISNKVDGISRTMLLIVVGILWTLLVGVGGYWARGIDTRVRAMELTQVASTTEIASIMRTLERIEEYMINN